MNYTITFYLGIFIIILIFLMERVAFFKDEEFLRAVRDTMGKDRISLAKKTRKANKGYYPEEFFEENKISIYKF